MERTTVTWRFVLATFFLKHGRTAPSVNCNNNTSAPTSVLDCLDDDPVTFVNASVDRLFQLWDDEQDEQFHSAIEELRQFTERTDSLSAVVDELLSMLVLLTEGGELLLACVSKGMAMNVVDAKVGVFRSKYSGYYCSCSRGLPVLSRL